jgi:type I restriction enzyme S subunit
MKPPPIDIRPDQWAIVRDILQRHVPQYEVWAFGSRATWKAKEYSDLDLAVITDKPLSLAGSAALADDFSESDLPWKVDVVDWATTSESFRTIIERDKVVVQEAKAERAMGGEWRTSRVFELQLEGVLLVEDGNHGEYRPRPDEFAPQGAAFIRAADMQNGRVLFDSASKINERARERITKGIGAPGDVLLSHKGTVGKTALVPDDAPAFVCSPQTTFWRTLNPSVLDRRFLYAYLRSAQFQSQLDTRAGETDMAPYVSLTSQRSLSVLVPPIEEQHAIANILGTLDDKIDVNHRMNETLEAIARAIFKSWFVEFDPVRAKASGEAPETICRRLGLTPDLLALFPDRLVDSELSKIPEGWEQKRVDDILALVYGKALRASDRIDGPVPVYGSGGLTGFHDVHLVGGPGIIVGRKGTVGSLYWEDRPFYPIDTVFYVVPKVELTYCFYLLETLGLDKMNTDAAVPGLNRNNVYRLPTTGVPGELRSAFDNVVKTLRARQFSNDEESEILATIRDTLLAKLLSGELRVPDAEAITEEAAA